MAHSTKKNSNTEDHALRLDKWLWAARFYKTRALAREVILGGKVQYNGQRCKPSKIVEVGAIIKLTQGHDEKIITVMQLSANRLKAELAQLLYQESDQSIKKREENHQARKLNAFFSPSPDRKPDKKQRRTLIKFKQS
ncbi:ribosome-associated heat shock protein Hsp15 [Pseudoalteromonas tunicata]|uniref:Heat shock protein 15 n=1 Tax=Pseudoalteromonas tunicata D2 TaxID=87626 RepID=A4CET9_9GAMM|nr:ribosome-associated heat shock protein Hsp15 [Pseudoalteromonas tunicata]ATC96080.1 ribosome-associated heat shock protein Hsp15 [Pseudoalteromonas tunicata]AXT31607.1 ribosome-associated heat shock protein Hsp15 [Pseudoalteromonas tunicata]EAR26818.1 heat shock protein 15, DNA/RNA-binding [Pseudoalteromonas tunicata D2]MDP5213261.1 ribosome-associated heat shock protein Hsp15 [Pseudoalteromonas tunicata]